MSRLKAQLAVLLVLLLPITVHPQEVVKWAVHFDRPDYGGWGARLDLPDLLMSSSGRYEILDHKYSLGTCQRRQQRLDDSDLTALTERLVPVLRRYELDPIVRLNCIVSDVGDSSTLHFSYALDTGRTAAFALTLQPYWCGNDGDYNDLKALQALLRHLADALPTNCE